MVRSRPWAPLGNSLSWFFCLEIFWEVQKTIFKTNWGTSVKQHGGCYSVALMGPKRWVYNKSSRPVPGLIYFDWTVGQSMRIYNEAWPFLKMTHAQIPLSLYHCSKVEKSLGQGWMVKQVPHILYTRLGKCWLETLHLTSPQCSQGFGCSDKGRGDIQVLLSCQNSRRVFSALQHRDVFCKIHLFEEPGCFIWSRARKNEQE